MSVDNLLNFNGVDGTQVFTDDGLFPAVWTVENGTPVLSTTEKKFGLSSLRLDGSSNLITTSFDLGDTANVTWTLEIWVWIDLASPNTGSIINFHDTLLNGLYYTSNGSGSFGWYDLGGRCYVDLTQAPIERDRWYHVAIVNNNGNIRLFCNGIPSRTSFNSTFDYTGHSVRIGKYGAGATLSDPSTCYIDSIRFTPDEALYNIISKPADFPQIELTTTTSPPPVLPTDHSVIVTNLSTTDATNIYIGIDSNHSIIGGNSGGSVVEPDATSTNIISGNVEKLGLPFGANVAVVSLGVNAEILGTGVSDPVTGDYSIDVYPHVDDVLIYVAPEYGNVFSATTFIGVGQIVHPSVPNRYVYVCTIAGNTGGTEPNWGTQGLINSGGVTFNTVPLHRPLMNGFIKPVVTPI
jgi:hypothetical protein